MLTGAEREAASAGGEQELEAAVFFSCLFSSAKPKEKDWRAVLMHSFSGFLFLISLVFDQIHSSSFSSDSSNHSPTSPLFRSFFEFSRCSANSKARHPWHQPLCTVTIVNKFWSLFSKLIASSILLRIPHRRSCLQPSDPSLFCHSAIVIALASFSAVPWSWNDQTQYPLPFLAILDSFRIPSAFEKVTSLFSHAVLGGNLRTVLRIKIQHKEANRMQKGGSGRTQSEE